MRKDVKLSFTQAEEIRTKYKAGGVSLKELAELYSTSKGTAFRIVHNINYKPDSKKHAAFKSKTIGEYRESVAVKGKHPSWVHAHIRRFARIWYPHLAKSSCRFCPYTKHVELAHIKPLKDFPDSALLSEVNSEDNIIPLCPNCHWEFDNLPR